MNKIFTIIRGSRCKKLNRGFIGYTSTKELPPIDIKSAKHFNKVCAIDYDNNSISPFFLSVCAYPELMDLLSIPELSLNFLKMVHSGQNLTLFTKLQPNMQLTQRCSILNIHSCSVGEILTLTIDFSEANLPVAKTTSHFLIRDEKRSHSSPSKTQVKETSAYSNILTLKTRKNMPKLYSKVSKDTNPIHTSYLFARLAGLKGRVMHGMHSLALATHAIMKQSDCNSWNNFTNLSIRFTGFMDPGMNFSILHNSLDFNTHSFVVKNNQSKIVLNNGLLSLKQEG